MAVRNLFDDAALSRLLSNLALAPVADRAIGELRCFTSEFDDLADLFGSNARGSTRTWQVTEALKQGQIAETGGTTR